MEEINIENWEKCQSKFRELSERRSQLKDKTGIYVSNLLYRGQSNAQWRLATTLERYVGPLISLEDYYRKISLAKAQIETFTKAEWNIPSISDYVEWLQSADFFAKTKIPAYEYMVYLRHHGFPSPLLDWTNSPFIAAYFAFHNIPNGIKNVSIYAYIEHAGKGKSHYGLDPLIATLGPNIRTHARHFLQQCEYTICTMSDGENHYYVCHENVFSENEGEQDLLWKINIPSSERFEVLAYLDSININAFSLFGSEESLMETLALREFHLRERYY